MGSRKNSKTAAPPELERLGRNARARRTMGNKWSVVVGLCSFVPGLTVIEIEPAFQAPSPKP